MVDLGERVPDFAQKPVVLHGLRRVSRLEGGKPRTERAKPTPPAACLAA